MTAGRAALACVLAGALLGCPADERAPAESASTAEARLPPPPPPARFEAATAEQLVLAVEATPSARAALAASGPMSEPRFEATLALARDDVEAGRLQTAERRFELLRTQAPPSGRVDVAAARLELARGNDEAAVDLLVRAYRVDAQRLDAMLALIALYRERGLVQEADEVLLRLERAADHMGHLLASDASYETRRRAIADLSLGVPNGPAARALLRALETDDFRARVAALEALGAVGTPDIAPRLERLLREQPDGRYAPLYREALDAISARQPTELEDGPR